jgi:hypothetical protein
MNKVLRILSNVQITSALIWAAAIIACSLISENHMVSSVLTAAAGFHVVWLSQHSNKKSCVRSKV